MTVEGTFLVSYGDSGTGKTTDDLYSFGGCALFLSKKSALITKDTVVGYSPPYIHEVNSLTEAIALIPVAAARGFPAVVIDDGTVLMRLGDWPLLEVNYGVFDAKTKEKRGHDRAMWSAASEIIRNLAIAAKAHNIIVKLNAHPSEPNEVKGLPGGPDFGWDKLVRVIPPVACTVLRAIAPPRTQADGTPWPSWDTMATNDTENGKWLTKDRWDTAYPNCPLNFAELLRVAGRPVPRPCGLEWMEEVVQAVATAIVEGKPQKEVTSDWKQRLISGGVGDERLIRWALRDGVHRSRFILSKKQRMLAGF